MISFHIYICILFFLTRAKLTVSCSYSLVLPKALRVDTENYAYIDFHNCPPIAKISTSLHSLPGIENTHSSDEKVDHPTIDPIKLTYVPKSKMMENRKKTTTPYKKALVVINYCFGVNCQFQNPAEKFTIPLNSTHGYVFMTTNRPAYRPGENVHISVAGLAQCFTAARGDLPLPDVTIKIKTPISLGRMSVQDTLKRMDNEPTGMLRHTYEIPEDPMTGVWWAEAVMNNEVMATTSFVIDKYVLPTFDVKIEMEQHFILPGQEIINGEIRAHYSYGEPVDGRYYLSCILKYGIVGTEKEFFKIPKSPFGEAIISGGKKKFSISTSKILEATNFQSLEDFIALDGKVIILATVTGRAQAVYESDMVDDIIFSRTPYIIDMSRSAKFFFPRKIYEIKAIIKDVVSGHPISGVPVTIKAGDAEAISKRSGDNGEIYHAVNLNSQRQQEHILISTNHDTYKLEEQSNITLSVDRYDAKTELGIQLKKQFVDVGDTVSVELRLGDVSPTDIRYYVVSRGEIVYAQTKEITENGDVAIDFEVTHKMVPFSRVVAYYFLNGEVTANSAWFDVTDQCLEEITIEPQSETAKPGEDFKFTVSGPANAKIEFSAVDRAAYFVHNSSRLTRNTLWRKMEAYDTGCSRKGGKNAMSVFKEAGLLYQSANINNQDLHTDACAPEGGARKKRAANPNRDFQLVAAAKVEKCRLDGQRLNLIHLTCEQRLAIISANMQHKDENLRNSCMTAFEEACVALENDFYTQESVSRSLSANDNANEFRLRKRSDFKESWISEEKKIGDDGTLVFRENAPDSITIYEIAAFGMSTVSSFCIAKPKEVKVHKNVFIQLYLPYSVRVREQAVIRFAVFNYGPQEIEVTVKVLHSKEICTNFISDDFRKLVVLTIPSRRSATSYFTILPVKIPKGGKSKIELKAEGDSSENSDWIEKMLLVEPPGQHNDSHGTFLLSPDVNGGVIDFEIDLATKNVLAGTIKCNLYFYGHIMGPNIEVELEGRLANLQNLINSPGGCGEQNMIRIAPVVYIHAYRSNLEAFTVTDAQRAQTLKYIQDGYAHELEYKTQVPQGWAFAVWANNPPSTWLNGFVSRVFASARKYWPGMEVDRICQSVAWLLTQQKPDGHFDEDDPVHHKEMDGQVTNDITMTAFICISLYESRSSCPELSTRIQEGVNSAMEYLKNHFDDAKNTPYTVAIVAYAFAIWEPHGQFAQKWNERLVAMKIEDEKFVHWQGTRGRAADIETTAYGLLAEISLKKVTENNYRWTKQIANWLISQRNDRGGFISTQDTVVAIEALTKYMTMLETAFQKENVDLRVILSSTSQHSSWFENPEVVGITENDGMTRKTVEVPKDAIDKPIRARVDGTGEGSLSYRCTWRQYESADKCHFQVEVSVDEAQEEDMKVVKMTVSKNGTKAQMSIIDVVMLSGFEADKDSIAALNKDIAADGIFDRYELTNNAVKFYLGSIGEKEIKFAFKIKQVSVVSKIQPASVIVYDYYEPDIRCTKFYTVGDPNLKLRTICEDGGVLCKCAEGDCPVCRSQNDQLTNTQCSSHGNHEQICSDMCEDNIGCYNLHVETCKRDYVYIIKVESVEETEGSGYKIFKARIVEVIRSTSKHIDPKDDVTSFRIREDCYAESCKDPRFEEIARKKNNAVEAKFIEEGRHLLVYGSNPTVTEAKNGEPVQYIYELDDNARLEIVPSGEKCSPEILECAPNDIRCNKKKAKLDKITKLCKINSTLIEAHLEGCDV